MKIVITYFAFTFYCINASAQAFYGFSIDEKFSVHKNRIGISGFRQGKKHGKIGFSFNYNYSSYRYQTDITRLNNSGTGYNPSRLHTPPYADNLGANTSSLVKGIDVEVFNNLRLKTYKSSNFDLKISIGYGKFIDTYTTYFFEEKRKGTFAFNVIMCNMYFTYLMWYKKIGIEPLIGIAYYYPLLINNHYLAPNPFVAAELEAGISIYFQSKRNHQH